MARALGRGWRSANARRAPLDRTYSPQSWRSRASLRQIASRSATGRRDVGHLPNAGEAPTHRLLASEATRLTLPPIVVRQRVDQRVAGFLIAVELVLPE